MARINFSKEEEKTIKKALKLMAEDMEKLKELSGLDKIYIKVSLPGIVKCNDKYYHTFDWYLLMNNYGAKIIQEGANENYNQLYKYRSEKSKKVQIYDAIWEEDIIFMKNYDSIRIKLVEVVEKALKTKKEALQIARNYIDRFTRGVDIEIEMPDSLNEHLIEVEEKDGKKIGTFDFGEHVIRIITSSEISLVKKESEKIKRK